MVTPCWNWFKNETVAVFVYNDPNDYLRKFYVTKNTGTFELGNKFWIFKPKLIELIFMGDNILVDEWKKIEAEKIESMKDITEEYIKENKRWLKKV